MEAVKKGVADVNCKGKSRMVYIPQILIDMLLKYIRDAGIKAGSIFVRKNGRPLARTNIWSEMKKLCEKAGVLASKVYPHNLRHLFGKTYYEKLRNRRWNTEMTACDALYFKKIGFNEDAHYFE